MFTLSILIFTYTIANYIRINNFLPVNKKTKVNLIKSLNISLYTIIKPSNYNYSPTYY